MTSCGQNAPYTMVRANKGLLALPEKAFNYIKEPYLHTSNICFPEAFCPLISRAVQANYQCPHELKSINNIYSDPFHH